MAKMTDEQKQEKLLQVIKKYGKPISAQKAVELTKMSPDDVKAAGKALMKAGKVRFTGEKKNLLEIVPSKKKEAPAKKDKGSSKKKGKKAQDDDDDDWDEDSDDDEDGDDDDSDEDDEDSDDDDEDGSDDEDGDDDDSDDEDDEDSDDEDSDDDDDDDDEDEEEAPSKKKAKLKKPGSSKSSKSDKKAAPAKKGKEFTMNFKPIDTLTDKELKIRLENGLEAAEALHDDGHVEVAELIMRMLPKVRKQIKKREEDEDDD